MAGQHEQPPRTRQGERHAVRIIIALHRNGLACFRRRDRDNAPMDDLPPATPFSSRPTGPNEASPAVKRRVGIAMICAGLIFFYGCFWMIQAHRRFVAQAKHAQGTVVRMVASSGSRHFTWVPQFTFQDKTGKQWQATSHDSNGLAPYHEGDPVEVLYLPQNPAGARIGDLTSSWGEPAALAFFGVFLFGIGCLVCRTTPFEITIGGPPRAPR